MENTLHSGAGTWVEAGFRAEGKPASACPGAGPQAEVPTQHAESVRHDALMCTVRSDVGKFPALLHFHVAHPGLIYVFTRCRLPNEVEEWTCEDKSY